MKSLSILIEPPVNVPVPAYAGQKYPVSPKGYLRVHRQLATELFTNGKITKAQMTISNLIYKDGYLKSFRLFPASEKQAGNVLVRCHRGHMLVMLDQFLRNEGLFYEQSCLWFVAEPVNVGTKGIQLTFAYSKRRTNAQNNNHAVVEKLENHQPPLYALQNNLSTEQSDCDSWFSKKDRKQLEALLISYFRWRATQQLETDETAFTQSFTKFCQKFNETLLRLSVPSSLASKIVNMTNSNGNSLLQ
jgi:hypothetical protein